MEKNLTLLIAAWSLVISVSCASKESTDRPVTPTPIPNAAAPAPTQPSVEEPALPVQKAEVVSKVGNLREEKRLKAKIILGLPQYTWVEVVEAEDEWLYVKTLKGELGWIDRRSTRMLTPIPPQSAYVGSFPRYSRSDYPHDDEIDGGKELYDEVQRLKKEDGLTDRQAVRKILREIGEID